MQLQHAIRNGDDQLVSALDREIEPLIKRILRERADTPEDARLQLLLVCDLIRDSAGDKSDVLHNAAVMAVLLNRYLLRSNHNARDDDGAVAGFFHLDDVESADDATFAEAVVESLPDPVIILTRDHKILHANDLAARRAGMDPMDMVGIHLALLTGPLRYAMWLAAAIDAAFDRPGEIQRVDHEGLVTLVKSVQRSGPGADRRPTAVMVIDRIHPK